MQRKSSNRIPVAGDEEGALHAGLDMNRIPNPAKNPILVWGFVVFKVICCIAALGGLTLGIIATVGQWNNYNRIMDLREDVASNMMRIETNEGHILYLNTTLIQTIEQLNNLTLVVENNSVRIQENYLQILNHSALIADNAACCANNAQEIASNDGDIQNLYNITSALAKDVEPSIDWIALSNGDFNPVVNFCWGAPFYFRVSFDDPDAVGVVSQTVDFGTGATPETRVTGANNQVFNHTFIGGGQFFMTYSVIDTLGRENKEQTFISVPAQGCV